MNFALIPAGGHSRRMGTPKLLLPLGGRTVLERVVATLHETGVEHILVVVGAHVPQLVPLAEKAGADVLLLNQATSDMRATVESGFQWLEAHYHPHDDDNWLLVPADHPALDAASVQSLLLARGRHPDRSIIVPTYHGKRGHPVLIAWKHVAGMRQLPPGLGFNVYLRQHSLETLEVPVASPAILLDLDTPEDYERLLADLPVS